MGEIALGGTIDGAAEASNQSKIALGEPFDGAAAASNKSKIVLGGFFDVAATAAHESKIDLPRLKDPPEIQATTVGVQSDEKRTRAQGKEVFLLPGYC